MMEAYLEFLLILLTIIYAYCLGRIHQTKTSKASKRQKHLTVGIKRINRRKDVMPLLSETEEKAMQRLQDKNSPAVNSALNTLLAADYDEAADVMYIYFGGKPQPCKNVETKDLVVRYNLKGELSGITIVDFKKRIGR